MKVLNREVSKENDAKHRDIRKTLVVDKRIKPVDRGKREDLWRAQADKVTLA